MKLRAVILLFCFCSLLNDSSSLTDSLAALFRSNQTCSNNVAADRLKENDHPSANTDSSEESCCCSNPVHSVYLSGNGFNYCPSEKLLFKPVPYVVNHYRNSYFSSVWHPPAVV